jgi:hypothetical protein
VAITVRDGALLIEHDCGLVVVPDPRSRIDRTRPLPAASSTHGPASNLPPNAVRLSSEMSLRTGLATSRAPGSRKPHTWGWTNAETDRPPVVMALAGGGGVHVGRITGWIARVVLGRPARPQERST